MTVPARLSACLNFYSFLLILPILATIWTPRSGHKTSPDIVDKQIGELLVDDRVDIPSRHVLSSMTMGRDKMGAQTLIQPAKQKAVP
jgi:hypothetical protein